MNGVVFVAGVYGVGKSTLCERISRLIHMPFYSAGDLISEQVGEIYGENKKVRNKDQNQNVLIECISQKIIKEHLIMLAGHFCILGNDNKPEELPSYVYKNMKIGAIVLLETDSCTIIKHLQKRDGKKYTRELIEEFIELERRCAAKTSEALGVPLKVYSMSFSDVDAENIIEFMKEVCGEDFIRY